MYPIGVSTLIARLITDMKLNGVQPVVIWDEKGDRPWKAPEVSHYTESVAHSTGRAPYSDTLPRARP
jgi:hypothetical protein